MHEVSGGVKLLKPTHPFEDDMQVQRLPVPRSDGCTGRSPRFLLLGTLMGCPRRVGSHRLSVTICVKAVMITRAGQVTALDPGARKALLQDHKLPQTSSALDESV